MGSLISRDSNNLHQRASGLEARKTGEGNCGADVGLVIDEIHADGLKLPEVHSVGSEMVRSTLLVSSLQSGTKTGQASVKFRCGHWMCEHVAGISSSGHPHNSQRLTCDEVLHPQVLNFKMAHAACP